MGFLVSHQKSQENLLQSEVQTDLFYLHLLMQLKLDGGTLLYSHNF